MSERCLKPEELADLAGDIAADDPRRAHLKGCARCQAVLKSFTAFMDPTAVPSGADVADAHARLAAALEREIAPADNLVRPTTSFWTPFRVRTLAAAAAVLIVAVGISLVSQNLSSNSGIIPTGEPVLRGIGAPNAPFRCQAEMLDTGGFRVTWPRVAEATSYRVVVFDLELHELAAFDVGDATSWQLDLPPGASFCRVVALRGDDELNRSDPVYFDNC